MLPDKGLAYQHEMLRTADDAITVYDENLMPQHIVRVPSETLDRILSSDGKTDWESLEISRTLLDRDKKPDNASIKWAVHVMKGELLSDIDPADTETLSEKFMSISSVLSRDQWKALLDGLSEIETCSDEIEKAQNADQALFNERIGQEYEKVVGPIEARYSPEDTYLHPNGLSKDDKSMIETFDTWRGNEIDRIFRNRVNIRKVIRRERHITTIERSVNDLLRVIRTDRDKFRRDILTFMDISADNAAATGELLHVKPVPYKHLVNDPSIVPFEKKDRDAASILRNLHTPSHADLLGMDFSRLPLRAQVHFLLFRGKEDSAAAERFRLVLEKHPTLKDDIAYSFLATAEGSEYGETILSLAESLDTETLGPILKKYAEITKDADAVADFIRSEFPNLDETETASVAGTVTKNLLRRGRDLLVDLAKNVETDHISLLRKLDDVSAGVELYKKTFRTLYESGKLKNPAEMANTEILTLSPEDLSEKDREWMRGLYRKSYPESEYSSSFREAIFAGLDKRLEKTGPGTRCHILRRDGKNVSFVFFEDTGTSKDGRTEKFGSSFNVEPEYRSDMVGGAFWDTFLSAEAVGSVITITGDHALPNPVSDFYVNKKGFFGIGMRTVGDRPLPLLQYDEKRNGELLTRKTGMPMTFDLGERIATDGIPDTFDKWISAERTDRNGMEKAIVRKTSEGFLLAYILPNPNDTAKNDVILIFENPDARMKMIGSREMMRDSEAVSE